VSGSFYEFGSFEVVPMPSVVRAETERTDAIESNNPDDRHAPNDQNDSNDPKD
jgi:hypothetical protein